jgi:Glycosyl-transferase for dystroglycan
MERTKAIKSPIKYPMGRTIAITSFLGQGKLFKVYIAACLLLTILSLIKLGSLGFSPPTIYTFESKSLAAPPCGPLQEEDIDFTLIIQLSTNRLWLMEEHCKRWGPHPMSIVVSGLLSESAVIRVLTGMGCPTDHIAVQAVPTSRTGADVQYPVNELRNLALSNIRTTHAVIVDADFYLSMNMYDHLHQNRTHKQLLASNRKAAFVLPAFKLEQVCEDSGFDLLACNGVKKLVMPETKEELMGMIARDNPLTSLFQPFDFPFNNEGHGSTDYVRWMTSQADDEIVRLKCLTGSRYEPYLVIRYCQDMPPFQSAFRGYGQNKISWIQHLRHVGYQFYQVGQDFVIHFPHDRSASRKNWDDVRRGTKRYQTEPDRILIQFHQWLDAYIPKAPVMPYCNELSGGGPMIAWE